MVSSTASSSIVGFFSLGLIARYHSLILHLSQRRHPQSFDSASSSRFALQRQKIFRFASLFGERRRLVSHCSAKILKTGNLTSSFFGDRRLVPAYPSVTGNFVRRREYSRPPSQQRVHLVSFQTATELENPRFVG